MNQIPEFASAFTTDDSATQDLIANCGWAARGFTIRFRERSPIIRLRRDAQALENDESPDDSTFEPTKYDQADLLAKFNTRYNFSLALENQPSEATLTLVAKLHAKRSRDSIPLSKVTNASDNRVVAQGPTRITGTPFLIPKNLANPKKNTNSLLSSDAFIRAVKVLMNTYALVSVVGPDVGNCRCALKAPNLHIGAVGSFLRANALAGRNFLRRMSDSELNARTEWMRLSQQQTNMSLADLVTTVAQNHNFRPLASESKSHREVSRWVNSSSLQPAERMVAAGRTINGDGKNGGKGARDA